jgi:hypothetical protein
MGDDDRKRVKADIQANGYDATQPVWLYEGKVIDGINRCEICEELGIEPVTRQFTGTALEAIEFVIRTNKRRNLTSSQWAAIAAEADDLWEAVKEKVEEERRRKISESRSAEITQKIVESKPRSENESASQLAQNFNTNRTYVNEAKKYRETDPETFEQIKSGKLTINRARTLQSDSGDEWYTPRWLFDSLGLRFTIDVCAPVDTTHVTTPAVEFYNIETDGLSQDWHGTVWCNPPYSTPDPWARKMIEHGDGLLLTHIPMNAAWAADIWRACDGIRLFQAIEFVRPDGSKQRPGMWLQLAAFGPVATQALQDMTIPEDVADNPRRVPSPMWWCS